jgi:hypothetical protein
MFLPFPKVFYKNKTREVSTLFGDGLRLSDEPLKSFLAALFLEFLPDHIPASLVVSVEPVALQRKERHHIYHHIVTKKLHKVTARDPHVEVTAESTGAQIPFFLLLHR